MIEYMTLIKIRNVQSNFSDSLDFHIFDRVTNGNQIVIYKYKIELYCSDDYLLNNAIYDLQPEY